MSLATLNDQEQVRDSRGIGSQLLLRRRSEFILGGTKDSDIGGVPTEPEEAGDSLSPAAAYKSLGLSSSLVGSPSTLLPRWPYTSLQDIDEDNQETSSELASWCRLLTDKLSITGALADSIPLAAEGVRGQVQWIADQVRDVLGDPLTSIIVGRSTDDDRTPDSLSIEDVEALVAAWDIIQMLLDDEAADTIQAWFIGKNRLLNERSPAQTLREDPPAVIRAACAFSAYG